MFSTTGQETTPGISDLFVSQPKPTQQNIFQQKVSFNGNLGSLWIHGQNARKCTNAWQLSKDLPVTSVAFTFLGTLGSSNSDEFPEKLQTLKYFYLKAFFRENHHHDKDGGAGLIAWYINQLPEKIGDIVRVIQTRIWVTFILCIQPAHVDNYVQNLL